MQFPLKNLWQLVNTFEYKSIFHKGIMATSKLLKSFIVSYTEKNNLDPKLINDFPKKWEKYGDLVLFDERDFHENLWKSLHLSFWEGVAEILKCKRVGVKSKIKKDGYRTPNVILILGTDPWVTHKDNSILYSWNVEKSMFSSGNASERHRVAKLNCENEVVVDLFAGIGYFTLPFLIHAKAKFVHACEWNPAAAEALRRNLHLNKMNDKCSVYEGDNRLVCPKKVANRVNLGLLPTSENHWKTACEALVEGGGICHVHENVETKKTEICCSNCNKTISQSRLDDDDMRGISMTSGESICHREEDRICWKHKQWLLKGIHILHSFIEILSGADNSKIWSCSIKNINFVKSYAPHIHHIVFDVTITSFPKVLVK